MIHHIISENKGHENKEHFKLITFVPASLHPFQFFGFGSLLFYWHFENPDEAATIYI